MEKLVLGVKIKTWKSVYNKEKKILQRRGTAFKNTLKCCRVSGKVYNYKALQRVAG
jgi:hypothetical protein